MIRSKLCSIAILSALLASHASAANIYSPESNVTYILNSTALTYNGAEAAAVTAGGHLASIHSAKENDAVRFVANGSAWIGFTDQAVEGTFAWTDGSATNFTSWNAGEPNNVNDEDATEINGGGGWNDNQLGNSQASVRQVTGAVGTTFNNHTYHVITARNWTSAEAVGVALGGHLVSINSAGENAFVQSLIPVGAGSAWIGFNDIATEGAFVWSDGTPVTFTNWNAGEPNNAGAGENVAEFIQGSGLWNDNDQNAERFAVVEVVPEPSSLALLVLGGIGLLVRSRRMLVNC